MKKLLLIIGDQKQEFFIEGYSVEEGVYEQVDTVITITPIVDEFVSGIGKPSPRGIMEEKNLTTVVLLETPYKDFCNENREKFSSKIIEDTENFEKVDELEIVTQLYGIKDVKDCILDLIKQEKILSENNYIKFSTSAKMESMEDNIKITERISLYKKKEEISSE